MQIIKTYSQKKGLERLQQEKPELYAELHDAIAALDAAKCLTKLSEEKSKISKWGGLIFSPPSMNSHFQHYLYPRGWAIAKPNKKEGVILYSQPKLVFSDDSTVRGDDRIRKMDGIKDRVGLEVQFGKYAFMGYDVFSKMVIFSRKGYIDLGVEIVPIQRMVDRMSTGVSAFEHIMIDFEHRGEADIDIPVAVLGIGPTPDEWEEVDQIQTLYKADPFAARSKYLFIPPQKLSGGGKPGPK